MTAQSQVCILIWIVTFLSAMIAFRSINVLAIGTVSGWLLLPNFLVELKGLPDWDKVVAVSLSSGFAALLVDPKVRPKFKFSACDLPFILLCCCGYATSIQNRLGAYDGISSAYTECLYWVVPYMVGRFAFANPSNSRLLIRVLIVGILAYSALAMYEVKMSPRLHKIVFGVNPRPDQNYFVQAVRFGLWRPMVFMEHGLALAILMGFGAILACWQAAIEPGFKVFTCSIRLVAAYLLGVVYICVSSGAIVLTTAGWVIVKQRRTKLGRLMLALMVVTPFVYPIARMIEYARVAEVLTNTTESIMGPERAESFAFRVDNEEIMLERWRTRPFLGSASRFSDFGEEKVVTDSFWIAVLAKFGLLGWFCWVLGLTLPAMFAIRQMGRSIDAWRSPAWVMALCGAVFAMDALLNRMPNPLIPVMLGASMGMSLQGNTGHETHGQASPSVPQRRRLKRGLWPRPYNQTLLRPSW